MAVQTLKDLLVTAGQSSAANPDSGSVFSVAPQGTLLESPTKNDIVYTTDSGEEERLELGGSVPSVAVSLQWTNITDVDVGTLHDFWYDPTKGRGKIRTFLWQHPTELNASLQPQQYVVRFDSDINRTLTTAGHFKVAVIKLRVLGWYN